MCDVAARAVPLRYNIGWGVTRKAVCAAQGGGLVGAIGCRRLWLVGGSTGSYMIAFNPCVMFNIRICLYTGDCRLVLYFMMVSLATAPVARQSTSGCPSLKQIADIHRFEPGFVKKIESELWCHGGVLSPQEIHTNQDHPVGSGSISLTVFEQYIIIRLYYEDPNRHLRSYMDQLWYSTGKKVSLDTIQNLLLYGFPSYSIRQVQSRESGPGNRVSLGRV